MQSESYYYTLFESAVFCIVEVRVIALVFKIAVLVLFLHIYSDFPYTVSSALQSSSFVPLANNGQRKRLSGGAHVGNFHLVGTVMNKPSFEITSQSVVPFIFLVCCWKKTT